MKTINLNTEISGIISSIIKSEVPGSLLENIKEGLKALVVHHGFTSSNIRKKALNKNGISQMESPGNEDKMILAEEVACIIAKATLNIKRKLILTKLPVFLSFFTTHNRKNIIM